jgi:hypothetical protein
MIQKTELALIQFASDSIQVFLAFDLEEPVRQNYIVSVKIYIACDLNHAMAAARY